MTARENDAKKQYNRMTKEPVSRLIRQLSVPTVISMLVTTLYNMGDTYFVSGLGTSASGATGVIFGLMAIFQAIGFMFGHGAGTNISRHLGERNLHGAKKYSAHSFFLCAFVSAFLSAAGILLLDPVLF